MIEDLDILEELTYDPTNEYTWWCFFLITFAITMYYLSKYDA